MLVVIITAAIVAAVVWLAVHIFAWWAVPFLASFLVTLSMSLWKQHQEAEYARHAACLVRIAQLERELGIAA